MVQFNELRITPDNKWLIIDVSVKDLDIYSNVFLDSIVVDNQDTFTENGPSSNPVYSYTVDKDDSVKHYRLCISYKEIDLANELFFVYVIAKGVPDPSTPCGMDNATTVGVACNFYELLQSFMTYIREVERNCNIPKGFVDSILKLKALELALSTGHYTLAIKYWNKFFKDKIANNPPTCNCPYANY